MQKAEFNTSRFEFSHGKKPRGTGCWAFDVVVDGREQTVFAPGTKTFAEAKRWAREAFPRATSFQVAP